ncbi:MAG: Ig-like domain-containing protein, partial [Dehalococcoidia bacterium]
MKKLFNCFIASLALAILFITGMPSQVLAASNATTIGVLSLTPTYETISVYSNFSGDDNGNNQAILEYRKVGDTTWKPGVTMSVDRRAQLARPNYDTGATWYEANTWKNQWRAVIFWLTPNTSYEVRVTYTDADGGSGTVTTTTTTLNDNPPSTGTTYYISTTGSDSNTGLSTSAAFKTLQHAADAVHPGDKVLIMPGTYTDYSSVEYDNNVFFDISGTASNWITFQSYDMSNKAIINGQGARSSNIRMDGASYIRIKGLALTNPSTGGGRNVMMDRANNIIIEDCSMSFDGSDWGAAGVYMRNGLDSPYVPCSNILIQRNQITSSDNQAEKFGIYSDGNENYGIVIRNNTITGAGIKDGTSGHWHSDTFIYNNHIQGPWDDEIEFEGEDMNAAAWNNTCYSPDGSYSYIATAPVTVGPIFIFRNVFYGGFDAGYKMGDSSGGYVYFYNNTIYTRGGGNSNGISMWGDNSLVNYLITRNNIFDVQRTVIYNGDPPGDINPADWAKCNLDYDLMIATQDDPFLRWPTGANGVNYDTLAQFTAGTGYEAHGISVDGKFVNSSSGNFSLQATSPCIDKGVILVGFNDANSPWPYKGSAPDMGAYEYDSGAPTNHAPVAVNDAYTTSEDTVLTVAAAGVLSNDTDADGNTLTAIKVTNPSHGSVTLNSNGSFTYTPTANYNGSDSFTYKANDGSLDSNTTTVTITITAVNDAPVAVNDTYSTTKNTTLTVAAAGVLSNDTDVDSATLTAVKVTDPSHGSVTLNNNGSFTYTPTANYTGSDSFTYKANDGSLDSNTATVSITISSTNTAPVAVNDTYTTAEDTVLTVAAPGVLSNDTDADGDTLTAVKVTNPSHGSVTLNTNGSFTYTPTANYNGSDSFTYKANDTKADSNTSTVSITVTAVSDAPVAVNDSYSTTKNTTLTVAAPGVLSNDTDVDSANLTAIKLTDPSHGSITLNSNGSFTYTPIANYTGSDNFTYKANDGNLDSNTVTVSITVNTSNTAPVAVNDSYSATKNTTLTVAAPGVLSNDTDADGDTLTAIKVTNPSHGSVTLNANGSFTYTPTANFTGSDSFTYKANDGSLDSNTTTVSITVNTSNTAPVAVNDTYTTAEDTTLTVAAPGVLSNDTDADGDTLTAIKVTNPSHGSVTLNSNGSFSYTPTANYNGSDSFTYKANDTKADSNTATVSITITAVNDAPAAVNDSYTTTKNTTLTVAAPGVLSNDTDVDSANLTAIKVTNPSHGSVTLNTNGSFTYTPTANFTGSDSFTYKANDGSLDSNTATVSITVNTTNSAPAAVNDTYTIAQDTTLTVAAPGVLSNDTDADANTLTAVKVTDPSHGSVTLNANGSFTYTPASGYTGADSFSYQANDGQANSNVV